jgi:hypothetical protein
MVLKLVFGMICGCEDMTLKEGFSDFYMALLVQRMLLLCLTWRSWVAPINGL